MKKALLPVVGVLVLGVLAGAYAINGMYVNLLITQKNGLTYTFQCNATGFVPETYDWDIGNGSDRTVLQDVTYGTVNHTFAAPGPTRASCTAWDRETNQTFVDEIYFNVEQPNATVLEDVSFRGCGNLWIAFESFAGSVPITVQTSKGSVDATISSGDLTKIPGQYGDLPVFMYQAQGAKILGVTIGGTTYNNPNTCAYAPMGGPRN